LDKKNPPYGENRREDYLQLFKKTGFRLSPELQKTFRFSDN
jgi:hypothetical protein